MEYDEKPKRKNTPKNETQVPCPLCGSIDFEWGRLHHAWYIPSHRNFLSKMFSYGNRVYVRKCLHCNNLQLFSDG